MNKRKRDNKGIKNPMYGKIHSIDTKRKISNALLGKNPHNKGKKFNKPHHKKICRICNKVFYSYSNKFCSKVCVSRYRKNIKQNNSIIKCSFCGKEIRVKNSRLNKYNNHYCNNKCKNKHASVIYTIDKNNNWHGGKSFEPYTVAFNKSLKDVIRKRDNHTCRICNRCESSLKSKLCVHHIDYNKSNCSYDNLISLCKICHGKTNGNREYWKCKLAAFAL